MIRLGNPKCAYAKGRLCSNMGCINWFCLDSSPHLSSCQHKGFSCDWSTLLPGFMFIPPNFWARGCCQLLDRNCWCIRINKRLIWQLIYVFIFNVLMYWYLYRPESVLYSFLRLATLIVLYFIAYYVLFVKLYVFIVVLLLLSSMFIDVDHMFGTASCSWYAT